MLKRSLLLLALLSSLEAYAQAPIYKTYHNARFAYSISYPSNLLTPQGEAENGDGQKFLSSDGRAELIAWGSNNALDQTLKAKYDETRAERKTTYELVKPGWFVVSGIDNGKVFYQKTILRQNVFKTFRMEYDESAKAKWDPITARIAISFKG
jgi:hypothetical protein